MSNNRKRNLKKLARNIVGATAMLSALQTPGSAAEQQATGDNTGKWIAGAGLAVGIGSVASTIYSGHESRKLTESSLQETQKQNQITNAREEKKEARETENRSLGVTEAQVGNIVGNLSALASRLNKKCEAEPDLVRQILSERKAAAAVLRAGTENVSPASQNKMLYTLTDKLLAKTSAQYLEKGLRVLAQAKKSNKLQNSIGAMDAFDGNGVGQGDDCAILKRLGLNLGLRQLDFLQADGTNAATNAPGAGNVDYLGSGTMEYADEAVEAWNAMLPPGLEKVMKNCGTLGIMLTHTSDGTGELIHTHADNGLDSRADILKCLNRRDVTANFGAADVNRTNNRDATFSGRQPVLVALGCDIAQADNAARNTPDKQNLDVIPITAESTYSASDTNKLRKLALDFGINQFAPEESNDNTEIW